MSLHSPASVGSHLLARMGVTPPLGKFRLPKRELDAWCATLHGGWVTADVTGRLIPAADLDVRSCYPVLAHRLGWWDHLTAERVRTRGVTRELRRFLAQDPVELRAALRDDPATWTSWGCTRAVVHARGASVPVEVADDDDRSMSRLVVHSLDAERWNCTGLDLVAAIALDGEARFDVLAAVRSVPEGRQSGLTAVSVPGGRLDPDGDPAVDLVRLRAEAKGRGDLENVRRAEMLRVLGNALVYGLLAQFNPAHGGGEQPGPWCWPPLAATVTAGARCLLALLDADVRDAGGAVVCRDTDGAVVTASPDGSEVDLGDQRVRALSWAELDAVAAGYDALSVDGGRFWSDERGSVDAPLCAVSFGPKRYALCQNSDNGQLRVVASTEIALGGYAPPPTMPARDDDGHHSWCLEVARALTQRIADGTGQAQPFAWEHHAGVGFPVVERVQPSTPDALAESSGALRARPFSRLVVARARSFSPCIVETSDREGGDGRLPRPVALDPGGDLPDWPALEWRDAHTGRTIRVATDPDEALGPNVAGVVRLGEVARVWARPRARPLPETILVDPLLVRRVGRAAGRFYGATPQFTHGEADDASALAALARLIGPSRFADATGLPRRTADRIRAGIRPRATTIAAAGAGLRGRGLSLAAALDIAHRSPNLCAHPECKYPVRQFGGRCAEHQHEHDRLRKRRERAALTRGVTCRCGQTIGFGDVAPGWRAECCPSGKRRDPAVECPHCGARLLGDAIHAPACVACDTRLRTDEVAG